MSTAPAPPLERREAARPIFPAETLDRRILPARRLLRTARLVRTCGYLTMIGLVIGLLVVCFVPWQQSIFASGSVLAYSPQGRVQNIESPVKGRIVRFGEGIYENARVTKGQLILELQDLDANLVERLDQQLVTLQQQVLLATQQVGASKRQLAALEQVASSYESQLQLYQSVREQIVGAADSYVEVARQKVLADEQALLEERAALAQEQADFERQKTLFDQQIVSQLKFQQAERKFRESQAKVTKAEAYLEAAKQELQGKLQDREAKAQKASVDIDYAEATLRKARSDVAKAEAEISKSQSDLAKAEKEVLELQIKRSRQANQLITASVDGYLMKLIADNGSGFVKEHDLIATIVPDTRDRAVQLLLNGNDAPLVEAGRHVRLQFEGWPAVQFSGWPSVAVGTFGGTVASVDAADDGAGRFRVLVLPDPHDEHQWPDERYLRQGVQAKGWVMLNTVPLWFEIWRRLNAFPPTLDNAKSGDSGKVSKPPKLVKP